MYCKKKTKGAYVYDSLPSRTPNTPNEPEQITLMTAASGEDGPTHYEAVSRRRYLQLTSRCAELREAMAKQRAATARKFTQDRRAGDIKGQLIGPGSSAFARSSVHVQTGLFLEELTEQIEQDDFATQTDYFLDRPPTPLYVPAKTGVDVETQIYGNDLFDFELEVQPILEVLVGKTVEQALLEVMEEEELADLRCQQEVLQEIHNADLAEVARLEDRNRRYEEEKQRRRIQYEAAAKLAKETADKIAAKAFTKAYLSPLLKSTYQQLLERGYFYDSVEHDIEENFLEPLLEGVLDCMTQERRARLLIDGLIREAVTLRHYEFRELGRSICENVCLKQIVPVLRGEVAHYVIDRATRLALSRLELAASGTKEIRGAASAEIINDVMDEVALEVQAQKEAEEAAENAENTDEEF
ncbi:Flagellar radial spoke protein 3 [Paragonimus heterotremus]|uniref:Flagellar radial spoke protein 3 n=1 Tax=Paragonimus heterotremus TaxID=100268 RepID=A0A8J4WI12_9TREM|nr:Flagellar radial spoke protein 3 [Paragonimus heterotremus]